MQHIIARSSTPLAPQNLIGKSSRRPTPTWRTNAANLSGKCLCIVFKYLLKLLDVTRKIITACKKTIFNIPNCKIEKFNIQWLGREFDSSHPILNPSTSDNTETYQPGSRYALSNCLMQNVFVCQANKSFQLLCQENDCSSYIYMTISTHWNQDTNNILFFIILCTSRHNIENDKPFALYRPSGLQSLYGTTMVDENNKLHGTVCHGDYPE